MDQRGRLGGMEGFECNIHVRFVVTNLGTMVEGFDIRHPEHSRLECCSGNFTGTYRCSVPVGIFGGCYCSLCERRLDSCAARPCSHEVSNFLTYSRYF
jgi:hypothetical protein